MSLVAATLEFQRRRQIFDELPEQLIKSGFNAKTAGFLVAKAAMESKVYRPDYAALNGQPLIPLRKKLQPGDRTR